MIVKSLRAIAVAVLLGGVLAAVAGVASAAAKTVLCTEIASPCPAEKTDGVGTEIKASLVPGTKSKLTTIYKTIECSKSTINAKVTGVGTNIAATVEALSFEECNCTVAVLQKGTLELEHVSGTNDATVKSSGTEVTTSCSTELFGTVHCIYRTENTDIGGLEGGSPAKLRAEDLNVPRLSTNGFCAEKALWDVEYEVTSPEPLYVEPEAQAADTVLCTETATPCPAKKTDGEDTEIKASLVSGTKSKLTTTFKTIECGKSSITAKVTSTGERIGAGVEGLTFEECNCEVSVLAKGTIQLRHIESTDNATAKSTGAEVTFSCSTIFGTTHCIYKTIVTDLGTLEGGNPGKIKVSTELPRVSTSSPCNEEAPWEAEYEVTSPKPLYVEPEAKLAKTILCTAAALPCPAEKIDSTGTEIKASLVSGTKSKLTTTFKTIECGKSSITAKVTSTGERIGAGVEGLTFEECNCEVKVLAKGTFQLRHTEGTDATLKSTGTEVTTECSTIFGKVHCIYKTEVTNLGTLEGGNPAKIKITATNLLRLATNALCNEVATWEAEYEVTSPKPLYIEPE